MRLDHPNILAGVLAVQAVATVFFVADAARDTLREGLSAYIFVEFLIALALLLGLAVGGAALRRALAEIRSSRRALRLASGAVAEVLDGQFRHWKLTAAEADVALFALKGLDLGEIAALRNTAAGTVRAQLSSVYAKAGVSGRAQFAALFVEDILGEVSANGGAGGGAAPALAAAAAID